MIMVCVVYDVNMSAKHHLSLEGRTGFKRLAPKYLRTDICPHNKETMALSGSWEPT